MRAELSGLHAQINAVATCALASRLNGGKSCVLQRPSKYVGSGALTGCANYHARIRFDDGSASWLLRVPRVTGFAAGLPVRLAEYLVRSEFATLKFLELTSVPAPRAFSFGIPSCGTDHGVGVCFLLMEELAGEPWLGQGDASKVWKGLAGILEELEKHPFPKAGSLYVDSPDGDQEIKVSATASDRFLCIEPFGPYKTAAEYYAAWAEQYLVLIADGQLYPQFPVEAYLVYQFLKDNASHISSDQPKGEEEEEGHKAAFYLKHVDDKGDHILVDKDSNITGIIDWQMARVVPRQEAFGLSLVSADMQAFCSGQISLSANDEALGAALRERGARLACHTCDDKIRRFLWGLGLEAKWKYVLPMAMAILKVFGITQDWDEWKEGALRQYEGDERLRRLLTQQIDY